MKPTPDLEAKRLEVHEQQKPVVKWMREVMEAKKLLPTNWALEAGLARATVNRALKETNEFVTSTRTLFKLAKAAGVPPPIDLGTGTPGIPPSSILGAMALEMLRYLVPEQEWDQGLELPLGRALRQALLEMAEEVEQHGDKIAYARLAGRMAARTQMRGDDKRSDPENDTQ
jgi:hypothetical protein